MLYFILQFIAPIPLFTYNFYCQRRFLNQIVKSIDQSQRWQLNLCYNCTRQNSPTQFKSCLMVKFFWNRHTSVVKPSQNALSKPNNQNQNSNQEKTNIMVQINQPFHHRSLRILEQHLPRGRLICITLYPNLRSHNLLSILKKQ